jgi:hypothetical protein
VGKNTWRSLKKDSKGTHQRLLQDSWISDPNISYRYIYRYIIYNISAISHIIYRKKQMIFRKTSIFYEWFSSNTIFEVCTQCQLPSLRSRTARSGNPTTENADGAQWGTNAAL